MLGPQHVNATLQVNPFAAVTTVRAYGTWPWMLITQRMNWVAKERLTTRYARGAQPTKATLASKTLDQMQITSSVAMSQARVTDLCLDIAYGIAVSASPDFFTQATSCTGLS